VRGVSAGSCGVEVTGKGSRVIEAEGVMGVTGASRGFSDVRWTSVNNLFLAIAISSVITLGGCNIVPRGNEISVMNTISLISL